MKMRRNTISALVITFVGLVLLIGFAVPRMYGPSTNRQPIRQQRLNYQGNLNKTNPPRISPQPSISPLNMATADRQKADNIHKELSKMNELSQVGVLVTGNTALVGYSPSNMAKDVNATKTLITNKVKQTDHSIKNVVVSESADIMARINKLTTDIANKRPANEISNEINQLLKGVTPAVK